MKTFVLTILCLFCGFTYSQKAPKEFVLGLKNSKTYSYHQIDVGKENFIYQSRGKSVEIKIMLYQIDVSFLIPQKKGISDMLGVVYEVGLETQDNEIFYLRNNVNFQVGQYDFDNDGLDELVIAVQDPVEDLGITINVLKLKNGTFENIGIMSTKAPILSDYPTAIIKDKTITIERNLRGFYFEWKFEKGKFKDVGDY